VLVLDLPRQGQPPVRNPDVDPAVRHFIVRHQLLQGCATNLVVQCVNPRVDPDLVGDCVDALHGVGDRSDHDFRRRRKPPSRFLRREINLGLSTKGVGLVDVGQAAWSSWR
jgi:hypothetical protein